MITLVAKLCPNAAENLLTEVVASTNENECKRKAGGMMKAQLNKKAKAVQERKKGERVLEGNGKGIADSKGSNSAGSIVASSGRSGKGSSAAGSRSGVGKGVGKGGEVVQSPVTRKTKKGNASAHKKNDNVASGQFLSRKGNKRLSQERIIKLLLEHNGMLSHAAKALGVSFYKLKRYVESNETVQEALKVIEDATIETVESELFKNIQQGNVASIIFYLKTKGKKKGYIEDDREGKNKELPPITIVFQPPPQVQ